MFISNNFGTATKFIKCTPTAFTETFRAAAAGFVGVRLRLIG